MIDISEKPITKRVAKAVGTICLTPETLRVLLIKGSPKGNVWETARVAGVLAAKATSSTIPLCHPIELTKVSIEYDVSEKDSCIHIQSEIVCLGKTGAEMEALNAVSAAALTIYDMMKWKEKGMVISEIKLLHKSGGKNGDYIRKVVKPR